MKLITRDLLTIAAVAFVAVTPCFADDECSNFYDVLSDRSVIVRTNPHLSEVQISKSSVELRYSVTRKDGKKSLRARSWSGLPAAGSTQRRAILTVGASASADISDLKPSVEATVQEEFEGVDLTTFSATLTDAWKEGYHARLVIFGADQPKFDLFFSGPVYKRVLAEMQAQMDYVFANAAAGKCVNAPPPGGGGGGSGGGGPIL